MDDSTIKKFYTACNICPRKCSINRYKKNGFCNTGSDLKIAWAGLHFGEEPVLTQNGGSGAIFLTGCNLQCSFCQNYQISQKSLGRIVDQNEFVEIALQLQKAGAENINIVTGTHHAILLVRYLRAAKLKGLKIPIVWNTSSYESIETVRLLSDVVDIWLADLKTFNLKIATETFKASDYIDIAKSAILQMCELSKIKMAENTKSNKLISGVIVRHLALPGDLLHTFKLLKWFSQNIKDKALLSLMTQFTPVITNKNLRKISSFENRLISNNEDKALRRFLSELQIDEGFYQQLVADYDWLPDFTRVQTFSSKLSKPIWHYSCGFV